MDFGKLTEYLDSLNTACGIPCLDLKVMRDHNTVYRHMTGFSDHAKKHPVTENNLFDVYSATKVITMTAVMQLFEQGHLRLEDDVCDYLPEFKNTRVLENYDLSAFPIAKADPSGPSHIHHGAIRLRNLMSMTAGMSYETDTPEITACIEKSGGKAGTIELVKAIAAMPLLYEPGTRYRYSLGHDVIAAVVEIVSKEKFSDYINNHIFSPLGIHDMFMHPGETEKPRLVSKWKYDESADKVEPAEQENPFRFTSEYDSGGAGLACTTDAYMTVMDALACGGVGANGARILTEESIEQMTVPQLDDRQLTDFGRRSLGYSYGLGVRTLVSTECSRSPIGEFGWDGAAGAFCLVDTRNRLSLFYAQEVLSMRKVFFEVHPVIRDLVYEALGL